MSPSEGSATKPGLRRESVAQACTVCYQKKIRCDLSTGKTPCTNCSLYNTECVARLRKRRRIATSTQPPDRRASLDKRSLPEEQHTQYSPVTTPCPSEPSGEASQTIVVNHAATSQQSPVTAGPAAQHTPQDATSETTPTGQAHDGRAVYFASIEGCNVASARAYTQAPGLSPSNMIALQTSQAFELPSRAVKACYIDNFFKYCHPWAPVVERAWLAETPKQKPSLLLLQAVLLAGSRVTRPNDIAASSELYSRAKALFLSSYEQNPVILIIACLLLNWWNPAGPDRICVDNSQFWLRTGVGIAVGIGLHKKGPHSKDGAYRHRLWWCLVARDSQISAAHGRPRAIQMDEFDATPLTTRDFPAHARGQKAVSSVGYVAISHIFGDIGEAIRRNEMTPSRTSQLKNQLYAWVRELPTELRLFHSNIDHGPNEYNFEARQLHVIYFVCVILLFRKSPSLSPSLSASILAASFIAAIFEEFLIRDEIHYLGPGIWKFFLLTAGITLVPACKNSVLQGEAAQDYQIIKKALNQFAERYPSALGSIHTLETVEAAHERDSESLSTIYQPSMEAQALFQEGVF